MRYVVAGQQPWCREAFALVPKQGEWTYVETREALCAALTPRPVYAFFVHWSQRVPTALLEAAECVNFHCTALPYGRGGHPIENLILRGHTETVITAHRMTDALDAGPVYARSRPVSLSGTKAEILARFAWPTALLMRWIALAQPEPYPQVGPVVEFQRLAPEAYRAFWEARG